MGRMTIQATAASVLATLRSKGSEKTQVTYARHGMALDRTYGVSTADMKLIEKTIRGQQGLAYELYDSGMMEAMYLAGMVADGSRMTEARLHTWAKGADGLSMIANYTVPWVTTEHPLGSKLAVEWIHSKKEFLASSGWSTYSGLVMTREDKDLDLAEIEGLLGFVAKTVHASENRARSAMNSFVIAVGSYVAALAVEAKATALKIGNVSVDVGDTACKIPVALESIDKAEKAGKSGKKRKTIRC